MYIKNKKITFIGLGKMGFPIANNLIKLNYKINGFDIDPKIGKKFEKNGGTSLSTLRKAISNSDIIITMLPDGKIVNEVLLGKDQNVFKARLGALIIDMSSSNPLGTITLGEKLKKRGYSLVDAPVSGGVKRATNASMAIMIGGEKKDKKIAKKILQNLGRSVFDTGFLGSAHAMKALNNYVSACGLVAACEALIVGKKFGIKDQTIIDVLNTSTGKNNSTETKMKEFILSGKFSSGFDMKLMAKDLFTALDLVKGVELNLAGIKTASEIWSKASRLKEFSDSDHTEIFKYLSKIS